MGFEDSFFEDALHDMIDSNFDLYRKTVKDPKFGELLRSLYSRR